MRVDDLMLLLRVESLLLGNDGCTLELTLVLLLVVSNHALRVWILHESVSAPISSCLTTISRPIEATGKCTESWV